MFRNLENELNTFQDRLLQTVELISVHGDDELNDLEVYKRMAKQMHSIKMTTKKIDSSLNVDGINITSSEQLDEIYNNADNSEINPETNDECKNLLDNIHKLMTISPKTYLEQQTNFGENMITQVNASDICPITKESIKIPCRNTICNHLFEKHAILEFIESNPNSRCVVPGCKNRNPIKRCDLQDDLLYSRMLKIKRDEF